MQTTLQSTPQSSAQAADAVATAVRGLGYDLVAVERAPGGLMRVTIDFPWQAGAEFRFIGVDDCEKVSRQLQHVLEVEGAAYSRLEVSSPGLDRPLRHAEDFRRFSGERVEVTLRAPLRGRKHWRGVLQPGDSGWRLVLPPPEPAQPARGGRAAAKKASRSASRAVAKAVPATAAAAEPAEALDFSLADVREARLVPAIDFKGRRKNES